MINWEFRIGEELLTWDKKAGQAKYPKMKENFDILNTNLDL